MEVLEQISTYRMASAFSMTVLIHCSAILTSVVIVMSHRVKRGHRIRYASLLEHLAHSNRTLHCQRRFPTPHTSTGIETQHHASIHVLALRTLTIDTRLTINCSRQPTTIKRAFLVTRAPCPLLRGYQSPLKIASHLVHVAANALANFLVLTSIFGRLDTSRSKRVPLAFLLVDIEARTVRHIGTAVATLARHDVLHSLIKIRVIR